MVFCTLAVVTLMLFVSGLSESAELPLKSRLKEDRRQTDGGGNNVKHFRWGKANEPFKRYGRGNAAYDDDVQEAAGTTILRRYTRPNARIVSQELIKQGKDVRHVNIGRSAMVAWWGVFISHDLSMASEISGKEDCRKSNNHSCCSNIYIPFNDIEYEKNHISHLPLTRTNFAKPSTVRQQVNTVTSYLDASNVYGSDHHLNDALRDPNTGFLRVTKTDKAELLPNDTENEFMLCFVTNRTATPCFLAGDKRANVVLPLTALHTLFVRLHNHYAKKFHVEEKLTGDALYGKARKMVEAIIQKITYDEWLRRVLSPEYYAKVVDNNTKRYKYNSAIDATIMNVVATAALRFGHSIVPEKIERRDRSFTRTDAIPLDQALFAPNTAHENPAILDDILRGAVGQSLRVTKPPSLTESLTNKLFEHRFGFPLDLAAFNIQRGRDHGLPAYHQFKHDTKTSGSFSEKTHKKLMELYNAYNATDLEMRLDVWVGGLLENREDGSLVGPLFNSLLATQFAAIRSGDRFWYQNTKQLTKKMLDEVKKTTLASIIEQFTNITSHQYPASAFIANP